MLLDRQHTIKHAVQTPQSDEKHFVYILLFLFNHFLDWQLVEHRHLHLWLAQWKTIVWDWIATHHGLLWLLTVYLLFGLQDLLDVIPDGPFLHYLRLTEILLSHVFGQPDQDGEVA